MKVNILLIYIVIAVFLLVACNPQIQAPALLREAQSLVEDRPDSALKLIDSIFYPEKSLSKKQHMDYLITRVKAKRNTDKSIKEDTLIFKARDYFSKQKDVKTAAIASFYSGCVYFEQQNFTKAMQNFKDAELFAQKTDDVDLNGLIQYNIGKLYAEQDTYEEALEKYKLAQYWYAQSYKEQNQDQIRCFSAIGQMYALLNQMDSSIYYLQKGLNLALTAKNRKMQSLLTQNLSVVYSELKQYTLAKEYLQQSFSLNTDSAKLLRFYLNFADIYTEMGQIDSASFYVDTLKQSLNTSDDLYFKASAYNFLSRWEKIIGNYDKAFFYKDERVKVFNQIFNNAKEQSVFEIQKKYDFEQLQNRYNRKQINLQRWLIFLFILIITGGTTFTIYMYFKKNQLIEAQHRQEILNRMNNELLLSVEEKKNNLRNIMLRQLDVTRKIFRLNKKYNEGLVQNNNLIEQVNQILYGETSVEQQWQIIYNTFNKLHPGFSNKINNKYPHLTSLEFRICLLTYVGFKIDEISLVLNNKSNTIQTLRSVVRKKIGATAREDIATYLDRVL